MAARSRARGLDRARRCLGQDRTAARRIRWRDGPGRAMRPATWRPSRLSRAPRGRDLRAAARGPDEGDALRPSPCAHDGHLHDAQPPWDTQIPTNTDRVDVLFQRHRARSWRASRSRPSASSTCAVEALGAPGAVSSLPGPTAKAADDGNCVRPTCLHLVATVHHAAPAEGLGHRARASGDEASTGDVP